MKADIGTAISWINLYFDKNPEPVVEMLQILDQLQTGVAGIGVPALSASIGAIQNYRL